MIDKAEIGNLLGAVFGDVPDQRMVYALLAHFDTNKDGKVRHTPIPSLDVRAPPLVSILTDQSSRVFERVARGGIAKEGADGPPPA